MRLTIAELEHSYIIYSKGFYLEFHKDTKQVEGPSHADNLNDAIRDNVVIGKMKASSKEAKEMLKELATQLRNTLGNDLDSSNSWDELITYLVSNF